MPKPIIRPPATVAVSSSLRDARKRHGIGLRRLAEKIGVHPATLSAWELGIKVAPPTAVAWILGYLRVESAEYDRVMALAPCAGAANLVDQSDPQLGHLLWTYEQLSTRVVEWAPSCIPDLLQTRAYAERVLDKAAVQDDRRDMDLLSRQVRQQALNEGTRRYVFLVSDQALYGLDDLHEEQIEHLRAVAQLKHVTVRIVPSMETGLRSIGAFTLFEDRSHPIAVVIRHHHCNTYLTGRKVLSRYHDTTSALLRRAFDESAGTSALSAPVQIRASR
ncbi:Scr1 family TA system antitoxin-like transcriptional regulator [Amycolatopsis sp. DG1A-15b]|uniref:Scr1 family TA system antitoxin-like transcriptional regulator n=1 Tax=Amycolatopsis sp. DG1A-15b TaxID=3052846 RepID=UPI00255C1538|nr:Scr1 family TA system antitoxin-like transcriptional regulator [Amycolatopsis sp. DG1A-15b]WIX92543.1 Scr1 family TA system antitoxin-like transcriptional regulator [Amycolatopsis sp. DG1A-15b]